MADGFRITVEGGKSLERTLKAFPDKVNRRVIRSATSNAMTPVLQEARRRVPVDTGQLKKSLGKKNKTYARSGIQVTLIGPRKGFKDEETGRNPANYGHLVELGFTARGNRRVRTLFRRSKHKVSGRGFLSGSLRDKRSEVFRKWTAEVHRGIIREAEKARRSQAR